MLEYAIQRAFLQIPGIAILAPVLTVEAIGRIAMTLGTASTAVDDHCKAKGSLKNLCPIPLVYNPAERPNCNTTVFIGFMDCCVARGEDGWVSIKIPNKLDAAND